MKRLGALTGTAILIVIAGCGKFYDKRLETTIDNMKYLKVLDRYLSSAPTGGKWQELSIYVRPPRNVKETKEFQLPVDPGMYDLTASFLGASKENLHVLARVKRASTPTKKTPAPTANRHDFSQDVFALVNSAYGIELGKDDSKEARKKREEKKRYNTFVHYNAPVADRTVQVYMNKTEPYDVALIFEYPSSEQAAETEPIKYTLESFAVGKRAGALMQDPTRVTDKATTDSGTPVTF
jgi:hypothetical protein